MIPQKWKEFFAEQRKQWTEENLGRKLRVLRHQAAGRVLVGSQELVNFSSNDYLGLAGDLRIAEAAAHAAGRFGWGAGASRLVTGTSVVHNELEHAVAKFRGMEASLSFGSGFLANLGVISSLAGPGDTVFSDALNHASIIAACRLSGAEVRVYKHLGYEELEKMLSDSPAKGKRLIVTDTLFSVDGDVVDLSKIYALAEKFEALVVVDDAHANAVLGKKGKGIAELQDVLGKVDVVTASFSKALGSFGGFVSCSRELRDHLINTSRPFIYTTAMPITLAAGNIEALRIVSTEGEALRQKLASLVRTLRTKLSAAGFEPKGEHHIVPIPIGKEEKALAYSEVLENQGMLVHAMRYPTVPKGKATLRVSLSAAHTDDDVYRLVNAFKVARDKTAGKGTGKITRREAKRPEGETTEVMDDSTMSGLTYNEMQALVAGAMPSEPALEKKTDKVKSETKPEEKSESPAEKPAEKPIEKVAEKVSEKPAERPQTSEQLAMAADTKTVVVSEVTDTLPKDDLPDPPNDDTEKQKSTRKKGQTRIHKKV